MTSFMDEVKEALPAMRAFARSLTRDATSADDLVQDALVRLLTAQERFIPGSSFKAWAFTVIRNRFVDQYRRKRYADSRQSELNGQEQVQSAPQDSVMEFRDMACAFWELPAAFREVLILVGVHDLSYEEAAEIIGCPIGTVRSRLSRARARLAELMNRPAEVAIGTGIDKAKSAAAFLAAIKHEQGRLRPLDA
jgi:RNA polymerase sigma-70 factor (ECF subfamily)